MYLANPSATDFISPCSPLTLARLMKSDMGKIVLRLDRVMVERKISLNELAERVGISNVNLSKIKNNKVTAIRFSTLAAICEVLECNAGDILEYQKE